MLAPDEQKRRHIAASNYSCIFLNCKPNSFDFVVALKEEKNYAAYKEAHKPHYNFMGRVDGLPFDRPGEQGMSHMPRANETYPRKSDISTINITTASHMINSGTRLAQAQV